MLIIALIANLFLAFAVFESDTRNATNRVFALLAISTSLWLVITHVVRIPGTESYTLFLHRLGIFLAAPMSTLFFLLAHTFPSSTFQLSRRWLIVTVIATAVMMILNISPLAFTGVMPGKDIADPVPGPGLLPFSVISTLFSVLALYYLFKKFRTSSGIARKQITLVVTGLVLMLSLIIATVLVPIILFSSIAFLPLTPLYTLCFLGLTAYAIAKYQLFNIKVLLTQALTLVLCVVLFAQIFGNTTLNARFIDGLVFAFAVYFGIMLVRSVKREVQQRETIQKQELELEAINTQQESLLHFISHEIKGYLTKGQNAFAGIVEGDYGAVPEPVQAIASGALREMRKGVSTVMDILDASNFKKGTMTYNKNTVDIKKAVLELSDDLRKTAEAKGLQFEVQASPTGEFLILGDEEKLRHHVIRNLIDNSIRYTPSGKITVSLSRVGEHVRFAVSDTGVGIVAEDMKKLFTQGGKGKDSIKVNVDSTGFGLYVAKQVTEALGGKIAAHSDGAGKGAMFTVDLPAAK